MMFARLVLVWYPVKLPTYETVATDNSRVRDREDTAEHSSHAVAVVATISFEILCLLTLLSLRIFRLPYHAAVDRTSIKKTLPFQRYPLYSHYILTMSLRTEIVRLKL